MQIFFNSTYYRTTLSVLTESADVQLCIGGLTISYTQIFKFGRVCVPYHSVVQGSTVLLFVSYLTVWRNALNMNKGPYGVVLKGFCVVFWSFCLF